MHSDRESDQPQASTSASTSIPTTSASTNSPPRKKSKWDSLTEAEDLEVLTNQKKLKLSQSLQLKLTRERDLLLGGRTLSTTASATTGSISVKGEASRNTGKGSNSNSPKPSRVGESSRGTSSSSTGGSTRGGSTTGGAVRRVRDLHPPLESCRSVYCYERLNHIEEGSYGIVFRAKCKTTNKIVAIKKLKMDKEKNGFPITSLREIQTLMIANHENIVRVREICVGDTLTQVFIVMDFIEHDLKSLLATMPSPFLASEVKTLLLQLLSAISLCHDNWIIHRDLKTSNLLMNNRGQIKVADFGLARSYGEPLGDMTQLVVTLWYRAPELLLGATEYSTEIDMWSIGCIFGELILKEPLLPGKGEIDQLAKIFKLLGKPTEDIWPGFNQLPNSKAFNLSSTQPFSTLRQTFRYTTSLGLDLLSKLLTYDPLKRITAEEALKHPYFDETPLPKKSQLFASFPSVANGEKKVEVFRSPEAPVPGRRGEDGYDFV